MLSRLPVEPEAVGIKDCGIETYLLPRVQYSRILLALLL